jgi:integrase
MAATLPRGIQAITWKNKTDKNKQIRFRVRISRKTLKEDRLFDSIEEAKEFLALSKSTIGKEQIFNLTEKDRKRKKLIEDYFLSPPLTFYFDQYKQSYLFKQSVDTELKMRRYKNTVAFFKILLTTEVETHNDISLKGGVVGSFFPKDVKALGSLKPTEVTEFEVASYIRTRRQAGIKPVSISRELTFLSTLFKKLPLLDTNLKGIKNPALNYDRDLLKPDDDDTISLHKKREYRISKDEEETLIKGLNSYRNPEMRQIVLLSLFTAMRRSEILTLTWDQIKQDYIKLYITKSGRPRKVHLIKEARDLLDSIPKREGTDKVFSYGIAGFEGSFAKFKNELGLKHLRFHDLRRESISRFVENFGGSSSLLVTEILGFQSISKFEELYVKGRSTTLKNEDDLREHVGHSSKQMTKRYSVLSSQKPTSK